MKFSFRVMIAVLGLVFFSAGVRAETGQPVNFSADMVMTSGGQTMQSKVYVSEGKMRMEMGPNIVISRPDKNVSWMLMPEQQTYMENPIDRRVRAQTSREVQGEIERVKEGTEEITGKTAEKFKVTYVDNGKQTSIYQYIAADLEIPLKIKAVDGSWSMEYQNISMEEQPASLFEVPAGYQKFAMPDMADVMRGKASAGNE